MTPPPTPTRAPLVRDLVPGAKNRKALRLLR